MSRKEEILDAALDLAAEYGVGGVTLTRVAERVGMRTPSLYNHFSSRDELMRELYAFARRQAAELGAVADFDPTSLAASLCLEDALLRSLEGYLALIGDERMLRLLRVLYSARATNPAAAQLLLDELDRMVRATKGLFYALVVHGKMRGADVDVAAESYALCIHAMLDRQMDECVARGAAGIACPELSDAMRTYIRWFACNASMERGGDYA